MNSIDFLRRLREISADSEGVENRPDDSSRVENGTQRDRRCDRWAPADPMESTADPPKVPTKHRSRRDRIKAPKRGGATSRGAPAAYKSVLFFNGPLLPALAMEIPAYLARLRIG